MDPNTDPLPSKEKTYDPNFLDVEPEEIPSLEKLDSHEPVEFKKKFSFIHDAENLSYMERMELFWEDLTIKTCEKVKKIINGKTVRVTEEKIILNSLKGVVSPSTFTAILGPSGSGKTTLLNFLSGRIASSNLLMNGTLKMNGQTIDSIDAYSNKIAFVQQDDILMAVFTPREALRFSANIRLRISPEKREEKVNKLLRDLGLEKCADTIIGNELIRGVSGGERKRSSIGVELLTNPSMIFLDEPTTGLDSNTAITIMYLLRDMANSGRTIVSVIHQPSTEIFREFDKLILICKGNIIYQGEAQSAVDYFAGINYECPPLTNPSDFFMKIMNPEGLMIEMMEKGMIVTKDNKEQLVEKFNERVNYFTEKYKQSENYGEICQKETNPVKLDPKANTVPWLNQFWLLYKREFIKVFKNPFDLRVKFMQYLVFSLVCIIVYHDLGSGETEIQNTNGLLFFMANLVGMSSISGAILTFTMDRPVFLRECLNKSYTVSAFFAAKNICELIFQMLYPTILIVIIYFGTDLHKGLDEFWIFWLATVASFFSGSAYGLLISVFVSKVELAMALFPALVLPSMLFAGYLVNQSNIPYYFYEFEYISPFRYLFMALTINQYTDNKPDCQKNICDPLKELGFDTGMWASIFILIGIGVGLRLFALVGLIHISHPRRPKLISKIKSEVEHL